MLKVHKIVMWKNKQHVFLQFSKSSLILTNPPALTGSGHVPNITHPTNSTKSLLCLFVTNINCSLLTFTIKLFFLSLHSVFTFYSSLNLLTGMFQVSTRTFFSRLHGLWNPEVHKALENRYPVPNQFNFLH